MPKLKNGRVQKKKKHLMVMVASKKKSPASEAASDDGNSHHTRSRVKQKDSPADRPKRPVKKKGQAAAAENEPKPKPGRAPNKSKRKTPAAKPAASKNSKRKLPAAKKSAPPPKRKKASPVTVSESSDSDDVPLAEISKSSPVSRGKASRKEPVQPVAKEIYALPSEDEEEEIVEDEDEDEDDDDDDGEDDDLEEEIPDSMFYGPSVDEPGDSMTCSHCKGKFQREELHDHMANCPERYVQCRECGKVLSNLQTLERHHKRFHLKLREVPCTLCDKMFIDEAAARKHLKTVHFKVKNFHCPNCDKSFSQRNKLTYHIRTHSGEKPFSCTECGRAFSLLWNLKTHLRTHTGEKPYGCDVCGRRFTQKQNMTSHMTTHRKKPDRRTFPTFVGGSNSLDMLDSSGNEASTSTSALQRGYGYDRPNISVSSTKQGLPNQGLGGQFFMDDLGNLASITRITTAPSASTRASTGTAENQSQSTVEVNLENGLGLLSSVARKGDGSVEAGGGESVQVDGIVTFSDHVNGGASQSAGVAASSLDQIVEVFVQSSESEATVQSLTTTSAHITNVLETQEAVSQSVNTEEVVATTDNIVTSSDTVGGQGAPGGEQGNLAGLANILQNPQVLAAINAAASTNKFIVIGPVGMFGQDGAPTSTGEATTSDGTTTTVTEHVSDYNAITNSVTVNADLVADSVGNVDLASMENQLINAEAIVSQADSLSRGDVESFQENITQEADASSTIQCDIGDSREALAATGSEANAQIGSVPQFDLLPGDLSSSVQKPADSNVDSTPLGVSDAQLVSSEVSSSYPVQDIGEADSSQQATAAMSSEAEEALVESSLQIRPDSAPEDSTSVQNFLNVQELMSTFQGTEVRSADCSVEAVSCTTHLNEQEPQSSSSSLEIMPPCDSSSQVSAT